MLTSDRHLEKQTLMTLIVFQIKNLRLSYKQFSSSCPFFLTSRTLKPASSFQHLIFLKIDSETLRDTLFLHFLYWSSCSRWILRSLDEIFAEWEPEVKLTLKNMHFFIPPFFSVTSSFWWMRTSESLRNAQVRKHTLRTFAANPLVHISQKEKIYNTKNHAKQSFSNILLC